MKQRLLTAAIGLVLFAVVMFLFDTMVYTAALAVISILAVYELLSATKCLQNKAVAVSSLLFAAVVPFLGAYGLGGYTVLCVLVFILLLFGILLKCYQTVRIEQIGLTFFITMFFPFATASLLYLREEFGAGRGFLYTWLIFACAWGADAGAYFIGKFFGKRKLAPKISPNKTVEGFFGGFLGAFAAMGLVIGCFGLLGSEPMQIRWIPFILAGVIGTLLGVFGDLSASLIKRQCGIKDFGSIMPGHGGIADRFDSIFFVAPCFYMLLHYFPI